MQDQGVEASASISQLLRETYLAEREMHKAESTSHESDSMHHPSYVVTQNLAEAVKNPDQISDLSAFLTQEELDKSVSLAIQEIHQTPQEIKQLESQKTALHSAEEMNKTLKIVSNEKNLQLAPPSAFSEKDNHPDNPKCFHDNFVTVPKESIESSQKTYQEHGCSQVGSGKESKKELKNKAADFIEELSALFKTHNSKKIRPKICKKHGSKHKTKGGIAQECRTDYTNMSENRERHHTSIPINAEEMVESPSPSLKNKDNKGLENESEFKTMETSSENSQPALYFEASMSQPPSFIQKLKSREILEGAKVQLDCTLMGFPAPNVRWYCEGKELENSPDIQIMQDGNVHSLVISEAFQEDTGRYSCFASNIHGTDSTSAEIYIEGASSSESESDHSKEDIDEDQESVSEPDASTQFSLPLSSSVIHQEVHEDLQVTQRAVSHGQQKDPKSTKYLKGIDGKPLIAAPVFTKTLQDLLALEGQLIVFECRVKGAPSPKVEWYKEGSLIEDSPEFRILQKKPRSVDEPEEICTLVIAEVFSEDSGIFSCTASNKYGTVSSSAYLKVKGSEDYGRKTAPSVSEINVPAFKHQQLQSQLGHVTSVTGYSLRDPPSRLKLEGVLVNHNEPRPSSKLGLRVHFNLPDDIGSEGSSEEGTLTSNKINSNNAQEINKKPSTILGASSHFKEPPLVLAKPKLGPVQLQLLHSQVLLEQQQLQPSFKQKFRVDMSSLNSLPPPTEQQHESPANQLRKVTYPEPFAYTRPKEFGASRTTTTFSPLNSAVRMSSFTHSGKPPSPLAFAEPVVSSSLKKLSSQNSFADHTNAQTSTPTIRIQNPAAFLRTVLPSLPSIPPLTNNMGLPRSAPTLSSKGITKRTPTLQQLDLVCEKNLVVEDIKKKLYFKDDIFKQYQQEYKISSFEQRLMNEIEFRLERSPVDESDEEVTHDEIPTGKCIAPIFDKRLKHFRALEGTSVAFTCKVVGIPTPKVYWFKDGTQISKKNARFKMKRGTDGTCSLHIDAATNDDDGNYTIMAANPQGKISCSGHLLVQTPSLHVRRTSTARLHSARSWLPEGDHEPMGDCFFRPYFLQAPGDMVAHEGRLCRLDCKVSGLPTPELSWLLDGKPVRADASHRLLIRENGIHSLIIDPVSQNDAGTYTCIATNKAGQNAFNLDLNVVAKEVMQIPMFLEKLLNSGVPEGHPVRLEGRVVGMPPPVFYWKKDNETIVFSDDQRISMHQDMTGYVCLLIQPTKKDDAGWYTLSAKNEAGIVSCTARLDIYAQWHREIPQPIKKGRPSGSRTTTFTGQGLDLLFAFPTDKSHVVNASSSKDVVESDEL